jgi:hypothetical protein
MTLSQLTPTLLTSATSRDWRASVPAFIAGGIVLVLGLLITRDYLWVSVILAVAIGFAVDQWFIRLRHKWRIQDARRRPQRLPDPVPFDVDARVAMLRSLFADRPPISLVLFSFGSFVALDVGQPDVIGMAKQLIGQFGIPVAGTPTADTMTYKLPSGDFVIGGCHPSIFTFVPSDAIPSNMAPDRALMAAALLGRDLRHLDAFALEVVHADTAAAS